MFQHKSFNPKVIIEDHFDDKKNQIDIRTETIFDEFWVETQDSNSILKLIFF